LHREGGYHEASILILIQVQRNICLIFIST
jgi:hypothetical protein